MSDEIPIAPPLDPDCEKVEKAEKAETAKSEPPKEETSKADPKAKEEKAPEVQTEEENAKQLAPPNPALNNTKDSGKMTLSSLAEELKQLPSIAKDVMDPEQTTEKHLAQVVRLRKLLAVEKSPPVAEVIETGVVPYLIAFLAKDDAPMLQFEACWCLTNIASSDSQHTEVVIGATPLLARLIHSTNTDLADQALWCLGNLAGDSPATRNLVLRHGCMSHLLTYLESKDRSVTSMRNATWTLSNLCRGKPPPAFDSVRGALPVLARLLLNTDEEVLTDVCWALSYLSDGDNTNIQAVIDSGCCRRLIELLSHRSVNISTPALRTVGNIVTGSDQQTQCMLNLGVLIPLRALLASPRKSIRKEACWTISNITAGTSTQIQSVIDAGVVPVLVELLRTAEIEVKKEACWAISNMTSAGTKAQIDYLMQTSALEPLISILSSQDTTVIKCALEALGNILRFPSSNYAAEMATLGGAQAVRNLARSKQNDVAIAAQRVLDSLEPHDQLDQFTPTEDDPPENA